MKSKRIYLVINTRICTNYLILVSIPLLSTTNKAFPYAGLPYLIHGGTVSTPLIEIANYINRNGLWRPNSKNKTRFTRIIYIRVRTKIVIYLVILSFVK